MKKILLFCFYYSLGTWVNGQDKDLQVVASVGNTFQAGNLSLEWTLGEVVVDFFDESGFGISQGFHQPVYQLVAVKSIPAELGIIAAFPNPFSNELMVKMTFTNIEKGDMELLDSKGTSIWKKAFEGNDITEQYTTTALPSGSYWLVVSLADDASLQSYQLLKTQ